MEDILCVRHHVMWWVQKWVTYGSNPKRPHSLDSEV